MLFLPILLLLYVYKNWVQQIIIRWYIYKQANLALQKDLTPCAHQKDSGAACLVQSVKRAILDLGREF